MDLLGVALFVLAQATPSPSGAAALIGIVISALGTPVLITLLLSRQVVTSGELHNVEADRNQWRTLALDQFEIVKQAVPALAAATGLTDRVIAALERRSSP